MYKLEYKIKYEIRWTVHIYNLLISSEILSSLLLVRLINTIFKPLLANCNKEPIYTRVKAQVIHLFLVELIIKIIIII